MADGVRVGYFSQHREGQFGSGRTVLQEAQASSNRMNTDLMVRTVLGIAIGISAVVMAWQAVAHLGKQFRLHAGLYDDHALVRTGPYAIVRHPIYSSLLAMLTANCLLLTRWPWALLAVAIFIAGTEIRVRSEEKLLRSRFPEEFARYRRQVPAYLPFVR